LVQKQLILAKGKWSKVQGTRFKEQGSRGKERGKKGILEDRNDGMKKKEGWKVIMGDVGSKATYFSKGEMV